MHFPDLEVCCDWSLFFPLVSGDVRWGGLRDEPKESLRGRLQGLQTYDKFILIIVFFRNIKGFRAAKMSNCL